MAKEYKLAIKIAGEVENSLRKSANLSKSELRAISKEAARATYGMNNAFSGSAKSISGSLDKINKASNTVLKAVAKAGKLAGAGIVTGLGASVKVGADFEAQMSSVQAISGSTADEMKRLEKTALEYGSTTAFTAKEAGEALEYMALAGYDSEKSIAMLPNVLNLAAAGEMELGRASDQVTDAQSALGLSTKETTTLVDQMAQTASKSNTSVEQLGDAILQVGGTARILKGGTTELNQVLGLLADNGIKGAEGGTKLRNMILSLTAPTDKAAGVMERLGLNVKDGQGNFRDMSSIMQELNDKTKNMGDVEKSALLKQLFNKTDIKAVNALLGTTKERWTELGGEIDNASGAADKMAKTKLDNLKGDVTLFKSALEGTGVRIYKELQGPLRELVQGATRGVEDFAEWFIDNFPTIKSGIADVGEALMSFAQPFLSIGGWLLENPTVISGALGGIGTAIITFKVASGIKSVVTAISGIASLNPVIAIIGGVAVGIGALAAATAEAAREAKKDNLAEHFGDIALSMEDIEGAARQIVGMGDLAKVDELLSALSDTENIKSAMEDASKAIKKYNWKIEAGLTIGKEDTKEYVDEVKNFVKSAQDLIDAKGYEVGISTHLLFGDGKKANALQKESDAFYAGLDTEMKGLTDKLNEYLNDAMENGLSIDTEKLINETMDSISEITDAVNNAQTEADWDMLKQSWSGKGLTAESFSELQNEINKQLEKDYKGIEEGTNSLITSTYAKQKMGYTYDASGKKVAYTAADAETERKSIYEAQAKKKEEATNRSVEFQYNTMMDTYGQSMAKGELMDNQSTRDSVYEIVSKILESPGAGTSKYGSILRTIQTGASYDDSFLANLNFFNPFSSSGNSAIAAGLGGTTDTYIQAQSAATEVARAYTSADPAKTMQQDYKTATNAIDGDMKGMFNGIGQNAAIAGTVMGTNLADNFMNAAGPKIRQGLTNAMNGTNTSRPPGMPSSIPVPHAEGGIFNKPHIGMVGEAGTESVIPIRKAQKSYDLYKQTGAMLGLTGGGATFSPSVTINAPGADKKGVRAAAKMTMDEFGRMYKKFQKDQSRRSL